MKGVPDVFMAGRKEREEEIRKQLSVLFDGMMKTVYKTGNAQFSIDLLSTPQVREFVESHASVLDSSFESVPMSDAMRRRLRRSDYIFSGIKTFHELNEAFPSLVDENGERKSFERFLNDVRSVDTTYNANYLRAEYNFVAASAEMAAKWEMFMQDGDRYHLQYRTQKDDKVRPEHAALDGVTLPPSDSFWEEFYPPNGWNCFVKGTPVLTAAGWMPIEKVSSGMTVIGGSGEYRTVIGTHAKTVNEELVRVITKRSRTTCTQNHRFLTHKGWVAAGCLNPGDILVQVGEVSSLDIFVNAIHNTAALAKYCMVSLIRKRKPVSSLTVDDYPKFGDKKINNVYAAKIALLEWKLYCREVVAQCRLHGTEREFCRTHPLGMGVPRCNAVVDCFAHSYGIVKRTRGFKFFSDIADKLAVGLRFALTHVKSLPGKLAVGASKGCSCYGSSGRIVNPLRSDSFATMPYTNTKFPEKPADRAPVDAPMGGEPTDAALFGVVSPFRGISYIDAFNGFNSFFDFLRRTFFHTRYNIVEAKVTTKKAVNKVYNLSVDTDESYIVGSGIVHNCRCTVVQVRKSKYPATPHDEAMRLGDEALQRDSKGIFRFNPGIEQKTVPDYNPYTIRRCSTCPIAKGGKGRKFAAFVPDNEVCKACVIFHQCAGDAEKSAAAIERKHYLKEMEHLLNVTKAKAVASGSPINVRFTTYGNKHLFSDTFGRSRVLTKDDLKNLDSILGNATYIGESGLTHPRSDGVQYFYYFRATLRGKEIRLNVAKKVYHRPNGQIETSFYVYSVNDI